MFPQLATACLTVFTVCFLREESLKRLLFVFLPDALRSAYRVFCTDFLRAFSFLRASALRALIFLDMTASHRNFANIASATHDNILSIVQLSHRSFLRVQTYASFSAY